jgi:AAA domain
VIVAEVLDELSMTVSTWKRTDVVRQVARRPPQDLDRAAGSRSWIETMTDEVLAHPVVVRLAAPEPAPSADLRRRDGRLVFERHGAIRYTTHATLAIEQEVIDIVTAGRRAGRGVADADGVQRSIASAGLGEGQAAAVRAVTLDGHADACVVGPAGAGKSRTMGAAVDAWRASGVPVRGLAVSAVAAGVLQAEAGVPADTVAKLLFEHGRPGAANDGWRLRRGEVVVVDEARMVASRDLAHLAQLAHGPRPSSSWSGTTPSSERSRPAGCSASSPTSTRSSSRVCGASRLHGSETPTCACVPAILLPLSSTSDTGESRVAIGSAPSTPPSPPGTTPAVSARPWSSAPPTTPPSSVSLGGSATPESQQVRSS